MPLEYKTLSIELKKGRLVTEKTRPVKGADINSKTGWRPGGLGPGSSDAKGSVLWGCEPARSGEGRATTGMATQEGDPVLNVLPFRCKLASTCRCPNSKFQIVWFG